MTIDETMNRRKTAPIRPGQLSVRRQRIERWAQKGRSVSINDKSIRTLGASLIQKRAESSLFQAERHLNMHLFQLGDEREKLLEQHNFDQKLFANKQALLHKDNQDILRTLNYVRKCCKYSDMNDNEEDFFDSSIFLEENRSTKTTRSRSLTTNTPIIKQNLSDNRTNTSLEETSSPNHEKHIELLDDNDSQKRHVQFHLNTKRGSQSAHASGKSRSSIHNQRPQSAHGLPSYPILPKKLVPPIIIIDHADEPIRSSAKLKRPSSRIYSSKNSLQEFRRYPERFLSTSNRYLPLLRRQATEIESHEFYLKQQKEKNDLLKRRKSTSRYSDGSDLAYDDAKSFLSEEIEAGKFAKTLHLSIPDNHDRRNTKKLRAPSKIDLMETAAENTSEYTIALSRLRDHEYAHLQRLIRSNSIEHILQPFSSVKTLKKQPQQSRHLNDVLQSIDSLRYSSTNGRHRPKQIDIEKNLSKLGILIS